MPMREESKLTERLPLEVSRLSYAPLEGVDDVGTLIVTYGIGMGVIPPGAANVYDCSFLSS